MFTRVYLCLAMFTTVDSSLPMLALFFTCLPLFNRVYHVLVYLRLPMFTRVYLCLHLLNYVNPCLLVFTYV